MPRLWLFTDPVRTPDPLAAVARLPAGAAVIYRTFGAADRLAVALALRRLTRARGVTLLIGLDWRLAAAVDADGVHLPQRAISLAPGLHRRRPRWLVTAAAHDAAAIVGGARWRLDAVFLSPIFPSRSASAGRAMGPVRFSMSARQAKLPVIALGGVNGVTARRLLSSNAAGIAAVEALS